MTINWKQGLFAAALLLSASLLFVGCGKCKTDKAVADKSTGEIIGEEIDVIEVVPAQTPNAKTGAVKDQKSEAPAVPVQPNNEAPAMTPPTTTPTENAPAPTPVQTPESATTPDASPSSTTSDVTLSTSCSDETSEYYIENELDLEPVVESESAFCCNYCQTESACSPACAPAVEACQSACDAAPACAPDPVCAPAPVCSPAPACTPVCSPCCTPCRTHHLRRRCHSCHICCRTRPRCVRDCLPCRSACEPACVSACMSACAPDCQSAGCSNGDCTGSWSNEQNVPADSTPNTTQPEPRPQKTTALPDPKISEGVQKVNASTAVGSTPSAPEAPSIVLPEAK